MSKPQKIKRYNNIYKRKNFRKRSIWKIVLAVVIIAGLVFIGYSTAKPLMNFLAGERNNSEPESSQPPSAPDEPGTSTDAIPASQDTQKGKVLPAATLPDSAAVDAFIQAAKDEGYTAVVVECKDADGYLYYTSALAAAEQWKTIHGDALEIASVANKISEAGMTPVAKIHAFQDNLAASVLVDNTFLYNGKNQRWLDNAVSKGGKGWLNPFKDNARQYIIDITNELIDSGFKQVVIDSVQFPDVQNLAKAGLGNNNTDSAKAGILQQFVTEVTASAKEKGASVIIQVKAGGFAGLHRNLYSMDIVNFGAEKYAPILDFGSLGSSVTANGVTVENPAGNVYEAAKAIISAAQEANPSAEFIPVITNTSDLEEVKRALQELSIQSYMVEG